MVARDHDHVLVIFLELLVMQPEGRFAELDQRPGESQVASMN